MRNCIITLFVFFVFGLFSYAQITASIKGASEKWLYLQTFTLSGYQKIDSARSIDGEFIFPITARTSPGVYMIGDGKNGFDFILNEKEIRFSTSWPQMQENLKVLQSDENVVWQQYRKERDQSYLHLELLNQVLVYYNPKSAYYAITFKEFTGIQEDFRAWTDSLISAQPESYVARYIKADRKPSIPPGLEMNEQKTYFKEHWFDGMNWMDNTMMTSEVLTSKITSYLGLYSNPNAGKAELSQSFMMAVDHLLPIARQNPVIFDFCIKYLVRGFERYGFEDVILHMATNYTPSQQCENEQQSETLARLEKYKLLSAGKMAPDIRMMDLSGKEFVLKEVKTQKLIVFWASWCPHCKELLPELVNWSKDASNLKIQVIPVSLDEDKTALEKAIKSLEFPGRFYVISKNGVPRWRWIIISMLPHHAAIGQG
ncbi:MAG: redoxin domain-containing protein [Bacteroidales bacterium]|nr:redoxin domain-containing protein [Bacteroidales bacterium]